ncbi:MAG: endolytic transglycosylase MltG [Clostridiales Family XIII bacterium]|jgi:UPF0755 protein|nr:endolytic transglycosylase MltG [Clostridiales Family XIII bacterium]
MAHRNREARQAKKVKDAEREEALRERVRAEGAAWDESYGEQERRDLDEMRRVTNKRRGVRPAVPVIVVFAVIIVGGFYGFNKAFDNEIAAQAPGNEEPVTIDIPSGATTTDIAGILKDGGLIGSDSVFNKAVDKVLGRTFLYKAFSKKQGYDGLYKEGRYTVTKSMDADEIAAVIIAGNLAETKRFTIPEGYNNTQIAKRLAEEGICDEAAFWDEVANGVFDYRFLEGCPEGNERLEGFLYPETYEVYADASAHDVIDKMLAQFDKLYLPLYYDRAAQMEMSVRDVVTMGSIIERESVVASERPLMAGVFYNRLAQGMRLESCATIQYILGEPKEFLTNADTQIESPYNTYLHDGLPPGPICNPRMASIEAALYPDENDYVYFVLSPSLDGTHNFSADYNEFLRNKDAYYAVVEG